MSLAKGKNFVIMEGEIVISEEGRVVGVRTVVRMWQV